MQSLSRLLPLALFAAVANVLPAQTHKIVGSVEDVQNTVGQFYLDCTNIPVTSNAVDLNVLQAAPGVFELAVTQIGTPLNPTLRIDAAVPALKTHDMGNLKIGSAERWEIVAAPGSFVITHGQLTSQTGWQPIPGWGVLFLGTGSMEVHRGLVGPLGRLQFNYTMPNMPQLLGTPFTSQSLVLSPNGTATLTNPDCREVRN